MMELTKEEREILKTEKKYGHEWIARDSDNHLFTFDRKPEKKGDEVWEVGGQAYGWHYLDGDLFPFIRWSDTEPTSIDDLLKVTKGSTQDD